MRVVLADRKIRLVVAILAVLAMLVVMNQFTGFFTDVMRINLSIAPSVQGNVYIIGVPGVVMENQQAEFVFALDNVGTRHMEGSIYVEIRDSLNATVDSFSSSTYSVQPGSYITYTAQWYATQAPGNYTLIVWDNQSSPTDTDNATFSIECPPGTYRCFGSERRVCSAGTSWNLVETCLYGCQAGTCLSAPPGENGGGGISVQPEREYSMSTEQESVIDVVQGVNYTHLIKVTNDGGYPLTNLTLNAWSDAIDITVPDIAIHILQPGNSAFFVIDIGVPQIPDGEYNISWEITSGEITKSGEVLIVLSSREQDAGTLCEDSINRYFRIIESLDMDIRSAEIRGYDMETPRRLLREALEELEVMRTLRDNSLFDECNNRVDVLRRKIEQTAMVYSVSISRPVSIIAYPWVEHTILILTVIALVVVIVLIVGWRKISDWYKRHRLFLPKEW